MKNNDNIKAGLFVLSGLIIALVVTFLLSDLSSWFQNTQEVKVYFQLSDGVQGLSEGSTVTLGGHPVGTVLLIEDVASDTGDERIVGKVVTVELPERIRLAWDAELNIVQTAITGKATLDIANTGEGAAYNPEERIDRDILLRQNLPDTLVDRIVANVPDGAIPGDIGESALVKDAVELMGIGEVQQNEIRRSISNLAKLTDTLVNKRAEIESIVERANNVLGKVEAVTNEIDAEEFGAQLSATSKNLESATADLKEIIAEAKQSREAWFKRIDQVLVSVDEATSMVNTFLKRNDPNLQKIVDHAKSTLAKLDEQTIEQVNKTLKLAREGVITFNEAGDRVSALLASQSPVIERTMASLQLTADQLKLAAIEVRRSPWRLLYEPSDKELETDNLYDAARSFALAAGALQSAAGSLESVSKARPGDEALIKVKLEELERLFEKYKETEATFWKRLKEAE